MLWAVSSRFSSIFPVLIKSLYNLINLFNIFLKMYDIIIVGSGVAGSYLSSLLADFNVLVIEKDKKVILKDSGIVSKNFDNFFDDKKLIKDEIDEMVAVSPSGYKFSLNSESPYAYLLERKNLSPEGETATISS